MPPMLEHSNPYGFLWLNKPYFLRREKLFFNLPKVEYIIKKVYLCLHTLGHALYLSGFIGVLF